MGHSPLVTSDYDCSCKAGSEETKRRGWNGAAAQVVLVLSPGHKDMPCSIAVLELQREVGLEFPRILGEGNFIPILFILASLSL